MILRKLHPACLLALAGLLPLAISACSTCRSHSIIHAASFLPGSETVSVHKMGGEIDVADAPSGADLATMGGNIHVRSVSSFAKVHTMGGDIDIDRSEGSVDASTMAGDISVHMTGSSGETRDIKLASKSGAILLTVPKDSSMDVKIKLAYTRNSDGKYRVVQHLGLTESQSTEWENDFGTPRKYIYVTGRVGSGQNHVTIDTINGDVILKQE